jgi:protease-4
MKKNYLLIGCLAFPILAIIAFYIGLHRPVENTNHYKPVKTNIWLEISPSGIVEDYNEVDYGFMGNVTSIEDICTKIRDAAQDKNVKGILLLPSFTQIRMTGINEIAEALKIFKQSGKPVLSHLDMQTQADYMLAALADTVAMDPAASGGLFFEGVQANVSFYKNLLDKLGLKVNVIKSGAFKGYGETYSNTTFSPETYGNLKSVLSDRYDLITSFISVHRKLTPEQVKAIFEARQDYLISSKYALESGLVDKICGKDEFLKRNRIEKKQVVAVEDYSGSDKQNSSSDEIAVCYLQGGISPRVASQWQQDGINADKVQRIIDQINEDRKIKAVVLRVNSPGGSALESELIYRKIQQLKAKVPVVVSMSGVAASGGYYISSPADYIVADPFTITGSIGVIQLLPDASGLAKKVGITNQTIGFGKYAGAMNLLNTPSAELLASLQRNSEQVYSEFKHRVVKYRKVDYDSLETLAGGRVWSAGAALENHLIDKVGTLSDAVMKAAELAKLKTYKTSVLPHKKQYFELLMERLNKSQMTKTNLSLETLPNLLFRQLQSIFKPYSTLCLMPYDLE